MADSEQAQVEGTEAIAPSPQFKELLPLLQWLERQMEQAVVAATVAYGQELATNPNRVIYLDPEGVDIKHNIGVFEIMDG